MKAYMDESRDIGWAIFGFFFGIWSFFWGFKRFRRKRAIENIPTSSVRSLAMGLVELIGKARKKTTLRSPLTNTECVFYRYTVERLERSGKHSHWQTVAQGDSAHCPFWLDDGTGRVEVVPVGAEYILPMDYNITSNFCASLPTNLITFLDRNAIHYKAFLGSHTMRFREWYITPGEDIYVLGTARKTRETVDSRREKLLRRLEELKKNNKLMERVDSNKDGVISEDEWDGAVAGIEKEVLEEELKSVSTDELSDVCVTSGDTEKLFIISDQSQKGLTNKLHWQAVSGIFGGAALSVVLLWYILMRLGVF